MSLAIVIMQSNLFLCCIFLKRYLLYRDGNLGPAMILWVRMEGGEKRGKGRQLGVCVSNIHCGNILDFKFLLVIICVYAVEN